MASTGETGSVNGMRDDYNISWFTEVCLRNIEDADRGGDNGLAEFFRRAQGENRKGAEQGKQLLVQRSWSMSCRHGHSRNLIGEVS